MFYPSHSPEELFVSLFAGGLMIGVLGWIGYFTAPLGNHSSPQEMQMVITAGLIAGIVGTVVAAMVVVTWFLAQAHNRRCR